MQYLSIIADLLVPQTVWKKATKEIVRILSHLNIASHGMVHMGSRAFMDQSKQPVESAAASHLIQLVSALPGDGIVYVVTIGAITNVASALLLEPNIRDKVVVVWLGGHPQYWPHNREFNLWQDPYSAQVVLDSGVPFIQIPCKNVAEHVKTTIPEMATLFQGRDRNR